jgi:hypothetical protein
MVDDKDLDLSMFENASSNNKKDDDKDLDFSMFEDIPNQEISQTESALRGAAQEATFGLADELTGIAETGLETVKGNVPLSASELLKSYQKLRDESRAAYKSAEEANPASYLGGQLVGGIAPAFVTGGTSVAAKLAAGAAKPALASLIKQGAVSGLKYGAAQGVGKSEAEVAEGEFGKLGKDIAAESILGGAAGAAMPLAAPAIKGATKSLSKGAKVVADLRKKLPGYDKAVTAFKWGEMGKDLTVEAIDPELQKFGTEFYKKITDAKGNVNTKKAVEALEAMGVKVDTKEAVDAAIADIEKIASFGAFETGKAAEILQELRKLRGDDLQSEKLINKLEKRILSKSVKDSTKAEQAIIKGEKKLMDQSLKTGDEIDTIMDLNRKFEDIAEIPTTTSEGTIGGVRGKLQRTVIDPETGEEVLETYSRDLTSDITPYQPTAPQVQIDPTTGRPIAISKDLGTGKIDAIIGDVVNDIPVDPSQVPLSQADDLISKINSYTNIAKTQGASSDPAVRRLQNLAGEVRRLQNKAIDESGLAPDLISSRKQMSNILEAEKIIGIDGRESLIKDIDSAQKAKEIAEFFGFEKGFKGREERRMAEGLLSDIMDSETKKRSQLLRDVNSIIGRTGDSVSGDTISRSSLFQQMVTKAPNLAGQGKKAISEAILNTSKAIQNATPNELKQLATRFASSSQKAAQTYAPMIEQAIGPNGQVRKSALFALYQQPAFRELMRSSDIVGQGADQSPLSQMLVPSNPTPPSSSQTPTYVPPTENEEEDQKKNQNPLNNLYNTFERQVGTSGRAIAKHLAEVESNFGKAKGVERIGMTKGVFHVTKDAALAVAPPELKNTIRNMSESQYAQYVGNNPKIDAELSGRYSNSLLQNLEAQGVVLENLNDNEIASVIGNLYNYPNQPKLKDALKIYSERKNTASPIELNRLKQNVVNQMDVIEADGEVSEGLVNRRNKEKKLFLKTPTAQNNNQASTQDVSGLLEKFAGIAGKGLRSLSNAIIPEAAAAADMPFIQQAVEANIDPNDPEAVTNAYKMLLGKEGIEGDKLSRTPTGAIGVTEAARKQMKKQDDYEKANTAEEKQKIDLEVAKDYLKYLYEQGKKNNLDKLSPTQQRVLLYRAYNQGPRFLKGRAIEFAADNKPAEAAEALLEYANAESKLSKGIAKSLAQDYNKIKTADQREIAFIRQKENSIEYLDKEGNVIKTLVGTKHPKNTLGIIDVNTERPVKSQELNATKEVIRQLKLERKNTV